MVPSLLFTKGNLFPFTSLCIGISIPPPHPSSRSEQGYGHVAYLAPKPIFNHKREEREDELSGSIVFISSSYKE